MLQRVWFALQLAHVMASIAMIILSVVGTASSVQLVYIAALQLACGAYSIVLWKRFGRPRLSMDYWQMLLLDESMQYAIVATVFSLTRSRPMITLLGPFTAYAVYHVANYTRTAVMPAYVARRVSNERYTQLTGYIVQLEHTQPQIVYQAAVMELFTLPMLVFSMISAGNMSYYSLLSTVVYFQFIRYRYANSAYTQQACTVLRQKLDAMMFYLPAPVHRSYEWLRDKLIAWSSNDVYARSALYRQRQQAAAEQRGR